MENKNVLHERWQLLTTMLNQSNFSAVVTGANANDNPIIFVNTAFEELTGYTRDEVIGKNCRFLQNGDREQTDISLISNNIRKYKPGNYLLKNYRKNGQIFWNKLYVFPIKYYDEATFFVGVQIELSADNLHRVTNQNTNNDGLPPTQYPQIERRRLLKPSLHLVNAQEEARKEIARELHDEFGQRLCALKMLLDHIRLNTRLPEANDLWMQAGAQVDELIQLVRNLAVSLRPPMLDYLGLEATIYDLLLRQLKDGPTWIFEYTDLPPHLPPEIEIAIYRIVQESVTNIVRHANAHNIVIEIKPEIRKNSLNLTIADDGIGFEGSRSSQPSPLETGVGIIGMTERVKLLEGTFEIESAPGLGTRIVVLIPYII